MNFSLTCQFNVSDGFLYLLLNHLKKINKQKYMEKIIIEDSNDDKNFSTDKKLLNIKWEYIETSSLSKIYLEPKYIKHIDNIIVNPKKYKLYIEYDNDDDENDIISSFTDFFYTYINGNKLSPADYDDKFINSCVFGLLLAEEKNLLEKNTTISFFDFNQEILEYEPKNLKNAYNKAKNLKSTFDKNIKFSYE